ncbi:MAG: mucoidy inhibitor MuiA family protein [Anaerolineales bacterium]|nr:mucoidy inhibitor MuiA family protein [Anaerolineales bacterium]
MPLMETGIVSVTLYPDRARVLRRGAIRLESGEALIEIADLPLQLNPDSMRAAARGARARLLGVQARRQFFAETPAENVRQLEKEIEVLQDSIQHTDVQVKMLEQSRASLEKVAGHSDTYAMALAAGEMNLGQQLELLDGLRQRLEKWSGELEELAAARRESERQLQKLTKELEQQRSARPRERYSAYVEVEMLEAGELTVEIHYVISGAGWKPLYDLRLGENESGPVLEVGYLAQVIQKTGEEWKNVSLTLSTARPALAQSLPELKPWYVQPPVPVMRAAVVPQAAPAPRTMAKMAATADMALGAAAPMPVEEEAEEVVAEVESSGMAVTYLIPASVTIPPDGAVHKVTVARFPLTPRLDYVCIPKLVEAVYRRAKVTNSSPYTLLAGDANIFSGEEFIGSTPLEMIAPQGEIELYLGVEDRVKVKRELKRRDVDKRFIGGKRHIAYGYEIKLENVLPGAVKIALQDQIPVARHEEIKVKLEMVDPKPVEQTELGLLKWEFNLEAKEKRSVRFDFSVEMPQAMQVIGLP